MLSPRTEEEALAAQEILRSRVILAPGPASFATVAGLDVAYDGDRLGAAIVVLDAADLSVRDTAIIHGRPEFPYITLRLTPRFRLPETTRAADHASRLAVETFPT
ncbi:endonuclease V [Actinoplanes sp. NPDC051861]|uniref:endonuclease V n=1 Tax=Actinoplanes sp. NPDC051861 TaxID=3155170 RepID=UPI0034179A8B